MSFSLSIEAANRAIQYSSEAVEHLSANVKTMNDVVNSNFAGLEDPAFQRYLELSAQMQDMLMQVSDKMEQIEEYCKKVIRWIQEYSET